MAIGKASDFKVYQEYLQTRVNEVLTQNGQAFGAASGGAINLTTISRRGDYSYEAFFQSISGLVSRRDTTSTTAATDLSMTQAEMVSVKLNRKIGPIAQTRDAWRKIIARFDETEFSGLVGEQAAVAMQLEMLNTGLLAARAALVNQSNVAFTVASNGTLGTTGLVDGLAKFGDAADKIVAWVMHSKPYYDLVKNQITANINGVSNFNVANGSPVTLNRPVIVTDSDSLKVTSGSPAVTDYYTLGLTANGVIVENTETEEVVVQDVTGLENLAVRIQGEFAYNLGLKGFQWDVGNGAANPNGTAVGTGSNWDPVRTSYKDYAGVVIKSR